MRYHTSIRFLQRSIMSLLNQYESSLNLKRGKIRVVSTKAQKVPMKKTPFFRSGKTGSDKLRQNQQRVQEWVEDQSSFQQFLSKSQCPQNIHLRSTKREFKKTKFKSECN